jgi:serine/threonine transporter
MCEDVSDTLVKVIRGIISFAPFGILGLIYESVSTNGMDIFVDYGHLILLLVAAMLIVMFITNPLIVFITTRRNPYPLLFACIKGSAITAFFTRSSAANIPMNLALCEKMGVDKELYSTSIPLGATINMNGAAITITVMTLAAAFTLGVDVPIYMAILLCIVSAFAACGASGVGGGSLLLIPLACSLLGISDTIAAQLIAIGFIIGVIQDSLETALNSSADAYFTAAAEIHENPDKELNL